VVSIKGFTVLFVSELTKLPIEHDTIEIFKGWFCLSLCYVIRRHRVVTVMLYSFFFFFLFRFYDRNFYSLLLLETSATDLKLQHRVQNGLNLRSNIFFGNLTCGENYSFLRNLFVRVIEPSRCKCCDRKSVLYLSD